MVKGWLALLCLISTVSGAGQVNAIVVSYAGGVYSVEVDVLIFAPEPSVHFYITDYNNLAQLNDAIEISEILQKSGPLHFKVRTVTNACIWGFCKQIHQVQDVIESPDSSINAVIIPPQSDFRRGYLRLNGWAVQDGTRILIRAEVEPDFWIPPLIGPWLIKRKLQTEILETIQNLERLASGASLPDNTPL